MPEIDEILNEALEHAKGHDDDGGKHDEHHKRSKLNSIIAAFVALSATFLAVGNVKGGNVVQAMSKSQVDIVDTWAFYQAKSTKESLAEAAIDQLTVAKEVGSLTEDQTKAYDKSIDGYKVKVARYEKEKGELQTKVGELQGEYDRLNIKDDQFDISEALLSVGIALFGITALTQKRYMLFVALAFAGFGFFVGLSGFFGLSWRPEWLAKFVGA